MAGFNQDKADEMLIKRVPHYGMNISAPFIDMRHWQEREETGTYEIDDIDKQLCSLVLDIQYIQRNIVENIQRESISIIFTVYSKGFLHFRDNRCNIITAREFLKY